MGYNDDMKILKTLCVENLGEQIYITRMPDNKFLVVKPEEVLITETIKEEYLEYLDEPHKKQEFKFNVFYRVNDPFNPHQKIEMTASNYEEIFSKAEYFGKEKFEDKFIDFQIKPMMQEDK